MPVDAAEVGGGPEEALPVDAAEVGGGPEEALPVDSAEVGGGAGLRGPTEEGGAARDAVLLLALARASCFLRSSATFFSAVSSIERDDTCGSDDSERERERQS